MRLSHLASLGLIASTVSATTIAAQRPASAGVDSIFAAYARPGSPGCAAGVVQNGRLVHERGYGSANLDYGIPLTPRSVFYLASLSKQFTAASVVLAARQGALSLDDDVHRWIPELPDYGAPITVRELLHHTSGLRDFFTLLGLAGTPYQNAFARGELLALVARQRALNFPPGSDFLYSNSGYLVLAEIVRRATGKSLPAFAEANIFRPLGMRNTHFHDDAGAVVPDRVIGYDRDSSDFRIDHYFNFQEVGDGGLYSTVEDLARWDAVFYGASFGGPGFVDQMLERGVLTNGDTIPYALGLQHGTYRGAHTVTHGGSLAGFRTILLRVPDERFSAIVLCNVSSANPAALAQRIVDVYLGARLQPVATAARPAGAPANRARDGATRASSGNDGASVVVLSDYAGAYESDELQVTYTVRIEGDSLVVERPPATRLSLRPTARDTFAMGRAGAVVRFTRDAAGTVTGFALDAGRVRGIVFARRR
jgi:CubicO group peptidase (beta-lactamase class C family)